MIKYIYRLFIPFSKFFGVVGGFLQKAPYIAVSPVKPKFDEQKHQRLSQSNATAPSNVIFIFYFTKYKNVAAVAPLRMA